MQGADIALSVPLAGACPQIRDLNSGTFGFVQLARDKSTSEYIAIKFIERGDKVSSWPARMRRGGPGAPAARSVVAAACTRWAHVWPHNHATPLPCAPQVTKYVEREILNHRDLVHPHIVQFKEVRRPRAAGRGTPRGQRGRWQLRRPARGPRPCDCLPA